MSPESGIVLCPQCGAKNRIPPNRWGEGAKCGKCHAPLNPSTVFPGSVMEVSDQTFSLEVLNFPSPVVFAVHAPWCGHCRTLLPVLDQLASEYAGRVKFAKMNIDNNASIPSQYGVKGVPTLFFFKGRQMVNRLVGSPPKGEIERQLHLLL